LGVRCLARCLRLDGLGSIDPSQRRLQRHQRGSVAGLGRQKTGIFDQSGFIDGLYKKK
jgi:hypothetical protein